MRNVNYDQIFFMGNIFFGNCDCFSPPKVKKNKYMCIWMTLIKNIYCMNFDLLGNSDILFLLLNYLDFSPSGLIRNLYLLFHYSSVLSITIYRFHHLVNTFFSSFCSYCFLFPSIWWYNLVQRSCRCRQIIHLAPSVIRS